MQDFIPSSDHLYQIGSLSEFSQTEFLRTPEKSTSPVEPNISFTTDDLPEQYKNVAFVKSIREKFTDNIYYKNDVEFIENCILRKETPSLDRRRDTSNVNQTRQETIRRFLSFKKGVRVVCDICKESFADKKSLVRHKVCRHEKFSPHQCTICKKMFFKPGDVRRHEAIHRKVRDFCCQFCEKTYKTNNHLQRHVKAKHKQNGLTMVTELVTTECNTSSTLTVSQVVGSPIKVEDNISATTTLSDPVGINNVEENEMNHTAIDVPLINTTHLPGKQDKNINEKKNNSKHFPGNIERKTNDVDDPVLESASIEVDVEGEGGGEKDVLLTDANMTCLNVTNGTLQNQDSINDQFFSRSDVSMCLIDGGLFP